MSDLALDPGAAGTVAGRWEACTVFTADGGGSPVCAGCGWLAGEHGPDAVVRQLPALVRVARSPRRLAS